MTNTYRKERKEKYTKYLLALADVSQLVDLATRPSGFWNAKTMRQFLENYAKDRGMDPLAPGTWYNTPEKTLRQLPVFFVLSFVFWGILFF